MCFFFFFNDTATTEIYTLSLHDALPIFGRSAMPESAAFCLPASTDFFDASTWTRFAPAADIDRKSTRLNSSHANISYAVFCLKKKKKINYYTCLFTYTHIYNYISHALN